MSEEEIKEFIQKQCSAAIDACDKYGYPTYDEPLCLILEDVIRNTISEINKPQGSEHG